MPDVDREEAVRYIIDGLDPKPFRAIWDRLPQIIGSMLGDNPGEDDEDMTVALLLDCFMELWHDYLWR